MEFEIDKKPLFDILFYISIVHSMLGMQLNFVSTIDTVTKIWSLIVPALTLALYYGGNSDKINATYKNVFNLLKSLFRK